MTNTSIPVRNCWVQKREQHNTLGQVIGLSSLGKIIVRWYEKSSPYESEEDVETLQVGFRVGWQIEHKPSGIAVKTLGIGEINAVRRLAKKDQVLVQLHETGYSYWLPYEILTRHKPVHERFVDTASTSVEQSEKGWLRLLAVVLENWNQNTGALGRFDIDPLPHQLHLVHHILSSGSLSWLIADDVGLGKTIEVGLLIAALKRTHRARRVLVICPASLTRQWQDEMRFKFDEQFEIYGVDFTVPNSKQWGIHEHVISSIDFLKKDTEVAQIREAPIWDIIVVDECHKLTRQDNGEISQRYHLVQTLRPLTNAIFFLSATPHQGKEGQFVSLLELLRPDMSDAFLTIAAHPEMVSQLIVRNRKVEVIDGDGKFVFHGQETHRIDVPLSDEGRVFQDKLNTYLHYGYNIARKGDTRSRAVGFVMTIFRKLASSSIAAVERALRGRLERLIKAQLEDEIAMEDMPDITLDDSDPDDLDILAGSTSDEEFFVGEIGQLQNILSYATRARQADSKLDAFLQRVIRPLSEQGKRLLIFTEYRATQDYLVDNLSNRCPNAEILQINGGMTLEEKIENVRKFNDSRSVNGLTFLVSTEAGGEGLNLHESCHVMANYDLPWNPSRLVQRIGRLYRYGQRHKVIVFNMYSSDTLDSEMLSLLYGKISVIAHQMAHVNADDYHADRLEADILGSLLDQVDVASILEVATHESQAHSVEEIERAIERAKQAMNLQDDYLRYAGGFSETDIASIRGLGSEHARYYLRGMLPHIGASLRATTHNDEVDEIRLPTELIGYFPEFGQREIVRLTTNRRLKQRNQALDLIDFESSFFRYLVKTSTDSDFDGYFSCFTSPEDQPYGGHISVFRLRYQDNSGIPNATEILVIFRTADGMFTTNPSFFPEWLLSTSPTVSPSSNDLDCKRKLMQQMYKEANKYFEDRCTSIKHPSQLTMLFTATLTCAPTPFLNSEGG